MWLVPLLLLSGQVQGQLRLDPLVHTSQGLVRGVKAEDGEYSMFRGIPYGRVDPENPFGPASPHPKFDQIFNAYDDSGICLQVEDFTNEILGKLDCLSLNIYVPNKASSKNKLPVLVWIHGGGFIVGSGASSLYGPNYLMKHDVILVTINYRLGPYGFMCLGTPEVPGNQGLKDQVLALRWIKENIGSFGGDVNKITAMGESAGSLSIDHHLLSKQEKLFNKAILQSGTVLKPRSVYPVDNTPPLMIANKLGFETEDLSEALAFLKNTDPKLVVAAASQISLKWRGCVENEFENVESIITKDTLLNNGIPKAKGMSILGGFNNRESLMVSTYKPNDYYKKSNFFRDTLEMRFDIDEKFEEMIDIVKHFYVGDEGMREEDRLSIIDFESDFEYNFPIQWMLKKYVENGAENVYQYLFSYEGGKNYIKNYLNITLAGVSHADELGYLFKMPYVKNPEPELDEVVVERITTLWTNFVKYGDPTPDTSELLPVKWSPISEDSVPYLNIDSELSLRHRPFCDRMAFWELFYKANHNKINANSEKETFI